MATRSTIAVQHADGTVSQVYCHWDGYLDHNGKLLQLNYNTQDKAEALVALGDISSLRESIEKPEGHTFDTAVDGYTIFYGRDRGETGTQAKKFKSFEEYKRKFQDEEYNYIYRNGEWFVEFYGRFDGALVEALEREAAAEAE